MNKNLVKFWMLLLTALLFGCTLSGCAATSASLDARNKALGGDAESPNTSSFQEAKQVDAVEKWKDQPGKIVNVYLIDPVEGGLLVDPIQCIGVPNSSTESLEPNNGWSSSSEYLWKVPVDGVDIFTTELPGKDGTFGDPVHFRYCLGVDGNYYDFPAYGLPYLVTSASFTFEPSTVKRDYETEARLMIAEEILKRGGCINPETLIEIDCKK